MTLGNLSIADHLHEGLIDAYSEASARISVLHYSLLEADVVLHCFFYVIPRCLFMLIAEVNYIHIVRIYTILVISSNFITPSNTPRVAYQVSYANEASLLQKTCYSKRNDSDRKEAMFVLVSVKSIA